MPEPQSQPVDPSSHQETIDAVVDGGTGSSGSGRPRVALVEGRRPRLETETAQLLRGRLRVAALLLCLASSFFFFRGLLFEAPGAFESIPLMNVYRGFVSLVLLVATIVLFSPWMLSLLELRAIELAVFGIPGLQFVMQHFALFREVANAAPSVLPDQARYAVLLCNIMWFAIVVIYGVFIPNTLWRGAAVLGTMAVAPVAIIIAAGVHFPAVGALVLWGEVSITTVSTAMAFVTGLYSTYKVGALRREAFEARQLGQYQLTEKLGIGGMGQVYLAEHRLLKRPCAVKLIRPENVGYEKALVRFEREVHAMAKLTHWNTVEVFDYGQAADGTLYYAMEYLPGLSVQEVVERQGPMQAERAIHLLRQVCHGLAEAHGAGLVHRDIKPSNIMVTMRGGVYDVAKLLDFGLAMSIEELDDIKLTQDGAIAGSPHYMAPERFLEDGEPDARCDIYSLGAVAFFMLTGRPPFAGDRPLRVMVAHAREPVTPPSQLGVEIPDDLEEIILICLQKDPDHRYQDIIQLERCLGECQTADRWSQEVAARWWCDRDQPRPSSESPALPWSAPL